MYAYVVYSGFVFVYVFVIESGGGSIGLTRGENGSRSTVSQPWEVFLDIWCITQCSNLCHSSVSHLVVYNKAPGIQTGESVLPSVAQHSVI